jgi:predicted nuclease with TOPRIM domain
MAAGRPVSLWEQVRMGGAASLQDTALTLGGLLFLLGGLFTVLKVRDWLDARIKAEAEEACREAREASASAKAAHEKVALLQSALTAYRETQAERLVSREILREVEDRLTGAIDRLGDRFDGLLREVIKQRRE